MKTITLGDLGNRMSVGLDVPSGSRPVEFGFRAWTTQDDLSIGKERADHQAMNPATLVDRILARMLTHWGPHDFQGMGEAERGLHLSRARAADVFTAWAQLRRATLGNSLPEQIRCRGCRTTFVYDIDLSTLECEVLEEGDFLHSEVDLFDGLTAEDRTGSHVHQSVVLQPVRWEVYRGLQMKDLASAKQKIIAASVVGSGLGDDDQPHERLYLTPEFHGVTLSKQDLELLSDAIDQGAFGPRLRIEPTCPTCGFVTVESISWVYDSFFSVRASSRLHRRKRSDDRSSISSSTPKEGSPGI